MALKSEQDFLDFLKKADAVETDEDKRTNVGTTNVYPDPPDAPEHITEPVNFTQAAQDGSLDVRHGVTDRVLSSKPSINAADRALMGSLLKTRDFETSNLSIKSPEKISHVRTQTLLEQTRSLLGRS